MVEAASEAKATERSARPAFQWDDPFLLEAQLEPDERMIRDSSARLCAGEAAAAHHRGLRAKKNPIPTSFARWARSGCSA